MPNILEYFRPYIQFMIIITELISNKNKISLAQIIIEYV